MSECEGSSSAFSPGSPPGSSTVGNAPSVLQSFGGYTYQDCYSDLVGGVRALSNDMSFANKTVEACLAACDAKGYIYCAIEYHGNECWASNTLGSQSTALGYGSCDLTCIDNPLQVRRIAAKPRIDLKLTRLLPNSTVEDPIRLLWSSTSVLGLRVFDSSGP